MPNINTDEKLINEVLERGVENIYPSKDKLKELLLSGRRLKLYCGYDPTAKSLHLGNAISINKLGQFQKLGHEVIFLVGDFTGMIGDPTDKNAARKKMTREETLENSRNYQKQAAGYLKFDGDNQAKVLHNSEWSDALNSKDLIKLTSSFTAQQMMQRDMFQERLKNEKPIYIHEFLYPIFQGFDSVAMGVDLEVGGSDQMFNMLCGRDLMGIELELSEKKYEPKEKFVLTLKLLEDETGKKMSKSEGNVVNLDETAENMFGQIMALPDGLISPGFELCTNVPMEEIKKIDAKNNPRDAKLRLAYEITKINHGEEEARAAMENFEKVFSKRELPKKIAEIKVKSGEKLADILVENNLAESKADAKRKIEQGGVSLDSEVIKDLQYAASDYDSEKILKVGKREFRKIILD